jgi:hypothetical protein
MGKRLMEGTFENTLLSRVFYHPKNMKIINRMIIKRVYEVSNGQFLIEEQDPTALYAVMRAIYLNHARHDPDFDITVQVEELNNIVTEDVVPGVISQIKQQIGYLDKVFNPRYIMEYGENTSIAGQKTLPVLQKFV